MPAKRPYISLQREYSKAITCVVQNTNNNKLEIEFLHAKASLAPCAAASVILSIS